ncbi:hypothetical protein FRC06_004051 [Ceratobasidium sp. 370]|nr:hypothetical protein FRC06_004051 [Ceratobasidium sp. 370]
MDNFLAECVNLDSALQQPGVGGWSELDATLTYADTIVSSLEAHPQIRDARATRGVIRNRSRSLVPLNKLPTEIIVYIMSLVNNDCMIDHEDKVSTGGLQPMPPLPSIPAVNKSLRDLLV